MGAKEDMIEEVYEVEPFHINTIRRILRTVEAKGWLRDPDEVPGRTITENELEASVVHARQCASFTTNPVSFVRSALDILGFTVVPDPEPTNAELINEAYDAWDRDPQSFKQSFTFGEYLDRLGWVKAPGVDDD